MYARGTVWRSLYRHPRLVAIAEALADPLRLAVLHHLMGGPSSVSELMTLVGAEQSRLSNHLAVLRERGLVRSVRQGRHVFCELHDGAAARLVESLSQVGAAPARTVKSTPMARGWIARRPGTRAVVITSAGSRGLERTLGVAPERP